MAPQLRERLADLRAQSIELPEATAAEKLIARTVVQVALSQHYNQMTFTPMLSTQWFQNYFESLDPGKNIFRQSDLDEFEEYAGSLYVPAGRTVQMEFPILVYRRYLERYREYILFCAEELYREADFSIDESLPIRRRTDDFAFPADEAEQRENWRLGVKNLLLGERLVQEALAKDAPAPEEPPEGEAVQGEGAARRREEFCNRTLRSLLSTYKVRCEASSMDLLEGYLNAFLLLFDPHTAYMAPESKADFDISMSLSLQGIGATLSWKDGYTVVANLVPGGPAAKDGHLKPGDRIIAVAQSQGEEPMDLVGMKLSRVVQFIRGPKGTEVFLTVIPEGSSDTVVYRIVREQVALKDSEAQGFMHHVPLADGRSARVLQLYLPSFYSDFGARDRGEKNYKSTTSDLKRLLEEALAEEGAVDGVVLDLRGNGGGSLDEAVALCGLFQANLPVVQVRNQQGGINVMRPSRSKAIYDGPLMVMVNRNSASASEIVAANLQDTGRAVIVGDCSTHGKGTVQTVNDLSMQSLLRRSRPLLGAQEPGSLKLTFAKFYRINGGSTQERGVEPDIVFPSFLEYMETSEKTLPHCLSWDEIRPVKYTPVDRVAACLPQLREVAAEYMANDPLFVEYAAEVDAYRRLRDERLLPLELGARRAFRAREEHLMQVMRRFKPLHGEEEEERADSLKSDEEKLLERQKLPVVDVELAATLAIMGKYVSLQE